MDINSFGEDLVVKTRKPYTIRKQREKWTEEEHNRFLEALKLYGRAWQRIEDHIGTKTAIQIRSHAQKFFTKLEKEAVATSTPLGQAHAIDIPPPRPKKKPIYPYPRKTVLSPSVAAEPLRRTKECSDDDDEAPRSVILNLLQDAPSSSIPINQSGFRDYVPLNASSLSLEVINTESTTSDGITDSDQNIVRPTGINNSLAAKGMQKPCVDGATFENGDSPAQQCPTIPDLHTCSAMSYISHPFPTYTSFADIPAALSREIASALLQNPAVYAAATMAASSLWPPEEMYSPTMAALVAATVAAASAWWATNGLISFPPPVHASGFAISPPATSFPVASSAPAPREKVEEEIEKTLSGFKPSSDAAARHDLDGEQIGKRDRSSCCSNATSSSEIETDAALKKNGETKDEAEEAQHSENLPAGEASARRARSSPFVNETWKEVSEQGRLAFQALFTRDSLPQSFATRLAEPEMELPEGVVPIGRDQITQNCSRPNEIKHGNLKVRRTGFKPYKRCAAEVEEVHDKSSTNKKIRVQGQVSS